MTVAVLMPVDIRRAGAFLYGLVVRRVRDITRWDANRRALQSASSPNDLHFISDPRQSGGYAFPRLKAFQISCWII
jgi:hypothetical protein